MTAAAAQATIGKSARSSNALCTSHQNATGKSIAPTASGSSTAIGQPSVCGAERSR
jgi:hypothetical protein